MTSQAITTRVSAVDQIAENIRLYTLTAVDTAALPGFSAGAHVDLLLDNGMTRQYSLCSDPNNSSQYQIAVQYESEGRGGSAYIHQHLKQDDEIQINPPRNHFQLDHSAERYVLIAGGIGITPIMLMAFELQLQGKDFELHYLCRGIEQAAFSDLLHFKLKEKVHFHFSQAGTEGQSGQRLDLDDLFAGQPENTQVYICGSERLLQGVLSAAEKCDQVTVNFERFSAAPEVDGQTNDAFEIEFASSGKVVQVAPEQSLLEVLRSEGHNIETMCEEGLCGSCEVNLLEGEAEHRDSVLTEDEKAEQSVLMVCCSRARSKRLVLDL